MEKRKRDNGTPTNLEENKSKKICQKKSTDGLPTVAVIDLTGAESSVSEVNLNNDTGEACKEIQGSVVSNYDSDEIQEACTKLIADLRESLQIAHLKPDLLNFLKDKFKMRIKAVIDLEKAIDTTVIIDSKKETDANDIYKMYRCVFSEISDARILILAYDELTKNNDEVELNSVEDPIIPSEILDVLNNAEYNSKRFSCINTASNDLINVIKNYLGIHYSSKMSLELKTEIILRLENVLMFERILKFDDKLKLHTLYRKYYTKCSDLILYQNIELERFEDIHKNKSNTGKKCKNNIEVSLASDEIVKQMKRVLNNTCISHKDDNFKLFTEYVGRVLSKFLCYNLRSWREYYRLYRFLNNERADLLYFLNHCTTAIVNKTSEPEHAFDATDPQAQKLLLQKSAKARHAYCTKKKLYNKNVTSVRMQSIIDDVSFYLTNVMFNKYVDTLREIAGDYRNLLKHRIKDLMSVNPNQNFSGVYNAFTKFNTFRDEAFIFETILNKHLNQVSQSYCNDETNQSSWEFESDINMVSLYNEDPIKITEDRIIQGLCKKYPDIYDYHLTIFRCVLRNSINRVVKRKMSTDDVLQAYRAVVPSTKDELVLLEILKGKLDWNLVKEFLKTNKHSQSSVDYSSKIMQYTSQDMAIFEELKCKHLENEIAVYLEQKLSKLFKFSEESHRESLDRFEKENSSVEVISNSQPGKENTVMKPHNCTEKEKGLLMLTEKLMYKSLENIIPTVKKKLLASLMDEKYIQFQKCMKHNPRLTEWLKLYVAPRVSGRVIRHLHSYNVISLRQPVYTDILLFMETDNTTWRHLLKLRVLELPDATITIRNDVMKYPVDRTIDLKKIRSVHSQTNLCKATDQNVEDSNINKTKNHQCCLHKESECDFGKVLSAHDKGHENLEKSDDDKVKKDELQKRIDADTENENLEKCDKDIRDDMLDELSDITDTDNSETYTDFYADLTKVLDDMDPELDNLLSTIHSD